MLTGEVTDDSNCQSNTATILKSYNSQRTTCYSLYKERLSWFDAYQTCQSQSQKLVTVQSQEVHNFLRNGILNSAEQDPSAAIIGGVWTGLHSHLWSWVDGKS